MRLLKKIALVPALLALLKPASIIKRLHTTNLPESNTYFYRQAHEGISYYSHRAAARFLGNVVTPLKLDYA